MRRLNALLLAIGFVALLVLPLALGEFELSIVTELLIFSLLPLSLDLMMGYAGLISFGHAAYFGLGAYTSAIILTQTGVPLPFAIICGAFVSGIVAGPIAYICTRSTGIYFSMLTLATSQLLYTIAYKWHSLTGGSDEITGVPRTALWPDGPSFAGPIPFYLSGCSNLYRLSDCLHATDAVSIRSRVAGNP